MSKRLARLILAFKKYKQYKKICKKLEFKIKVYVTFMYWKRANNNIDRLARVNSIWKGE